jgi:ABC-type nitrate/sulfonate/bicarbonate transport system substrate-binding protein
MNTISRRTKIMIGAVAVLAVAGWLVTKSIAADSTPSFSLAWSEYPSWSTFGVANELKLIDAAKGKMGPIEKKWGVDIELKEADYDSCIMMYGANKVDAAALTNMDTLNPSISRPSVAILPTSTSFGADALIVTGEITDIKQLKGKSVFGLAKTVSEYCFVRNLEILGEKEADYKFTNMDPAAAATALQQKQKGYDAIMVWNPFVLDTLNKRKDAKVLFDSTKIPGEIIDMVVVGQSSLDKPGGEAFAHAVIDTYYQINQRIADPKTHDATLVALGEKFSNLDLKSMETVVKQTKFYSTPAEGIKILSSDETKAIMDKVVKFCVSHQVVPSTPKVGFGDKKAAPDTNFRFDPTYIKGYQEKANK